MPRTASFPLFASLAFALLLFQCSLKASDSQQKITILGQVRSPQTLNMVGPFDIISAIEEAGGISSLGDVSKVRLDFDHEQSPIRYMVIDLEHLAKSKQPANLRHVTHIRVPEIRVAFRDTPQYDEASKQLKLSESDAREKIVAESKTADVVPKVPKMIVGRFYWFTNSEGYVPRPRGWYVDGSTGEVRDFYWKSDLLVGPQLPPTHTNRQPHENSR